MVVNGSAVSHVSESWGRVLAIVLMVRCNVSQGLVGRSMMRGRDSDGGSGAVVWIL